MLDAEFAAAVSLITCILIELAARAIAAVDCLQNVLLDAITDEGKSCAHSYTSFTLRTT